MDTHELIDRLGGGYFAERLQEALTRVSEEVVATGRKGSVGVSFSIECPDNSVADPIITVSPSFKMNMPQNSAAPTALYFYNGEYHRSPKNQMTFPEEVYEMQEGYTNDNE